MNDRSMSEPAPRPAPQTAEYDDEIDLAELVGVVREGKALVLAVWAAVLVLAVAYLLLAPPVYRAEALLQVKEATPSVTSVTDTIQSLLEGTSKADTEIQILQSRTLATQVVDATKLFIDARPRWFPLLGRALARRWSDPGLRDPLLGLASFAWGGEKIALEQFDVPKSLQDEKYLLIAGAGGAYSLMDPDGNEALKGRVGQAAAGKGVALYVSALAARPGTGFVLVRHSREDTVDDLLKNIEIAERGKDTGVIGVALEGTDPAQIQSVIEDYADFYVRNNAELKSQQAAQMLAFIQKQLPDLRSRAEQAEDAINRYQSRHGSVNVTLQTKGSLEQLADLEKQIADVQLKKVDLAQRFTPQHPAIVAVDEQLHELEKKRDAMTEELKKLPNNEWDTVRLLRDVKVSTELYTSMLNKGQELGIAKAGALGDARVVDHPILPETPVKPKKGLVLAIAFVLGGLLGVMVLFARRALRPAVRGPEELERVGLPVYATVPHARRQERLGAGKGLKSGAPPLLALHYPDDLATESLRSLRSSLHFALVEARNNVVALGGHAPGVGKTFVCANLGALVAIAGKRVLLIDADMRKGTLHQYFGGARSPGLSEVVSGQVALADALREVPGCPSLRFLASGAVAPNPSELLMSERFAQLVAEASKDYDLVLIDTPPVLAVTDATVVGRLCGALFFVVRAGVHPLREIELALRRMQRNGVRVNGAILNDMARARSHYGYAYQYHYGSSK